MRRKPQFSGINPSNKRSQTIHQHVEQRKISDLPDWAISHILSRLPTKDAVRTSVLSKEWEYKWTSVHQITFDDRRRCENESKRATFVNSIERTLLLLPNLQRVNLCCFQKYDLIRMKTWISTALSRNVQELIIWYATACFILPRNLLNSYSLRELMIISPSTLKLPTLICLPHLTTLRFHQLEIVNEDSATDLLKLNFPVLEFFELISVKWVNTKFVKIYAPKMTRFIYWSHDGASVNSIKVIGDSLVHFGYSGDFIENIVLSGSTVFSSKLNSEYEGTDLHLLEKSGLQIRKLLKSFSTLRKLHLSGIVVPQALSLSKLRLSLPIYYRMEELVLDYCCDFEVILELLHAVPILKFLRIYAMDCDVDYDAEDNVPSCVVSHLEEVTTRLSETRTTNELKLVKFFLKNAVKLKCLRVICNPLKPKKEMDEIEEELRTHPRASTCFDIVVTGRK